jgi:hypothetical protein
MTRRDAIRRGRAIIIAWAAGAIGFGLASGIYPWLMVVVFALTAVAGIALMRIRCEACSYPVFQREASIAGARFSYWSPIVRGHCVRCGVGADAKTGANESTPQPLKRLRVVLAFLIIVNLIGGIGLAQRVDARFIWVAIVVPAICLVVLALSFMGLTGGGGSPGRVSSRR